MDAPTKKKLITSFFQSIPEEGETDVGDVDRYYVDRKLAQTRSDPIEQLRVHVTKARSAGAYLFSGLRGSGKTTELVRLQEKLETEDDCIVFYSDISCYINLRTPLGVEDTIFAILGALSDAYETKFGEDKTRESWWQRAVRFMNSTIKVEGWSAKAGAGGTGVELKGSLYAEPTFRQNLRKSLSNSADAFLRSAGEYADEIVRSARSRAASEDARVILIVDSLERVSAATGDEKKMFDGLKDVFFNQREKLRFPTLTIIYSVPPYLDAVIPGVAVGFSGGKTFGLPHFKVITRDDVGQPYSGGVDLMVAVIAKRFSDWDKVVAREHLETLAFQSGGNMRRFFNLVRQLLVEIQLASVPLPLAKSEGALVEAVLTMARDPYQWLSEQDWRWLNKIAGENQVRTESEADLPVVLRLFDTSLVLDYQNGERWYQILPLIRPLLSPSAAIEPNDEAPVEASSAA